MSYTTKFKLNILATTLALLAALFPSSATIYAHGGEDHGAEKAPVVSTGAGMTTRVAHIDDYEVAIKHPLLVPDKELAARLFVTRFATNEPVGDAQIVVTFSSQGSPRVEATAAAGGAPGIYEVKLPPLPKGQYKLALRFTTGSATETADYGAVEITAPPASAVESESSWARTALIVLGSLVGLGLAAAGIYFAVQSARRNRIKGEAATA